MVPTRVPAARKKLFSSSMLRAGCDAAKTVIAAHCGCSSPSIPGDEQRQAGGQRRAQAIAQALDVEAETRNPLRHGYSLFCSLYVAQPLVDPVEDVEHRLESPSSLTSASISASAPERTRRISVTAARPASVRKIRLARRSRLVDPSFDQALVGEDVEQPHQSRAVDADQPGEVLLGDAAAGRLEMDQRRPGRVAQAGTFQALFEHAPPPSGEHGELEAEAVPGRERVVMG